MLDCNGNPTKDTVAQFLSLSTGKSYEVAYMDLITPKVGEKSGLNFAGKFDYSSLIKRDKFHPLDNPTLGQVADFMVEQTGCAHESAIIKLNMPKFSNNVKVIGGVKMYPVSMINAI